MRKISNFLIATFLAVLIPNSVRAGDACTPTNAPPSSCTNPANDCVMSAQPSVSAADYLCLAIGIFSPDRQQ